MGDETAESTGDRRGAFVSLTAGPIDWRFLSTGGSWSSSSGGVHGWSRQPGVRRTTIACVPFFSAHCFQRRCYSRIVDTTQTGSGSLPASKSRGPTSRLNAIAKTLSASAPTSRNLIERFFNKIKQCRRVATQYDKLAANYLAFVLATSAFGCVLMSPRPN